MLRAIVRGTRLYILVPSKGVAKVVAVYCQEFQHSVDTSRSRLWSDGPTPTSSPPRIALDVPHRAKSNRRPRCSRSPQMTCYRLIGSSKPATGSRAWRRRPTRWLALSITRSAARRRSSAPSFSRSRPRRRARRWSGGFAISMTRADMSSRRQPDERPLLYNRRDCGRLVLRCEGAGATVMRQ